MICYKWIIKKNNLYYPLRNFGIDSSCKMAHYRPYEIGGIYETSCELVNTIFVLSSVPRNTLNAFTRYKGFHFWKTLKNECLSLYNKCLTNKENPSITTALMCEVENNDIFAENDYQLVAKKFKVLKELEIK